MWLFGPNIKRMLLERDHSGLLAVLKDKDGHVASKAADAIAEMGFPPGFPEVEAWCRVIKGQWKEAIVLGPIGILTLYTWLKRTPNKLDQVSANLRVLDEPSIKLLVSSLRRDKETRIAAATLLGMAGPIASSAASQIIDQCLTYKEDYDFWRTAAAALLRMRPLSDIPLSPFVEILQKRPCPPNYGDIKQLLYYFLNVGQFYLLCSRTCMVIAAIGNKSPEVTDALIELLRWKPEVSGIPPEILKGELGKTIGSTRIECQIAAIIVLQIVETDTEKVTKIINEIVADRDEDTTVRIAAIQKHDLSFMLTPFRLFPEE